MVLQNQLVSELLSKLSKIQDKDYVIFADSPFYRNRNKRFVCGFHETIKHLETKRVQILLLTCRMEGLSIGKFFEWWSELRSSRLIFVMIFKIIVLARNMVVSFLTK